MTQQSIEQRRSCAEPDGPQWHEEWVELAAINQLDALQVRLKLDQNAIKRYADQTRLGMEPPPIKVGRAPSGALYLVDGWHRIEARALQTLSSFEFAGPQVLALVANLSEPEMRWEAARANMGHGVALKPREYRAVLGAFIRAKKHVLGRGRLMSYREMEPHIGKGHTTIRTWIEKDFPRLFKEMGGGEHGNSDADMSPMEVMSLAEEQCVQALKALEGAQLGLPQMTPDGRWRVRAQLQAVPAAADQLGVEEPAAEPF